MSHENEILDLINSSTGKAAPFITEKLLLIGDGKMSTGVTALTKYAAKSGIEIGEKNGLKKGLGLGILGTLTVVGAIKIAYDFHRKKVERISELQQVDQKLEVETTEHEETEQLNQKDSYENHFTN